MSVNGNDRCNIFFGDLKIITNETLKFKPLASTKMACLETDIPNKFNIALGKTSMYKVENSRLFLYDTEGNEILIFKKADE